MQNTFWSPSCICYHREETSASDLHALPYDIKIGVSITRNTLSHYKHGSHIKYISK